jgi:hypothetical protein
MPPLGAGMPPLGGGGAELLSSLHAVVPSVISAINRIGLIHRETEMDSRLFFMVITLQ